MSSHELVLTLVSALHSNIDSIHTTLQSLSSHPTHEAELQRLATEREARIFDLRTEHAQALQVLANQRLKEQQDIELQRQKEANELEQRRKQEWEEVLKRREVEDREREERIQKEEREREEAKKKEDECREAEREERELTLAGDIEKELERVEDEIDARVEVGKQALKELDEKRRAINNEIDKALNMPAVIPQIRYRSRSRTLSRTGVMEQVVPPPRALRSTDIQPQSRALQKSVISGSPSETTGIRAFRMESRSSSPDLIRQIVRKSTDARSMPGPKEKFPDLNEICSEVEQTSPGGISPKSQKIVKNMSLGSPISIHARKPSSRSLQNVVSDPMIERLFRDERYPEAKQASRLSSRPQATDSDDPMIARLFKHYDPMIGRLFTHQRYLESEQTSSRSIVSGSQTIVKNVSMGSTTPNQTELSSKLQAPDCHDPMIARLFKHHDPMIGRLFTYERYPESKQTSLISTSPSDRMLVKNVSMESSTARSRPNTYQDPMIAKLFKQHDPMIGRLFTYERYPESKQTSSATTNNTQIPAKTVSMVPSTSRPRPGNFHDPMIARLFKPYDPMIERLFSNISYSSVSQHADSTKDTPSPELRSMAPDGVSSRDTFVDEQPASSRSTGDPISAARSNNTFDPMVDRLFRWNPMIDRLFRPGPSDIKQANSVKEASLIEPRHTIQREARSQEALQDEHPRLTQSESVPSKKFPDPMIDRLFKPHDPMIDRLFKDVSYPSHFKQADSAGNEPLAVLHSTTQDKALTQTGGDEQLQTTRPDVSSPVKFHDPMIDRLFRSEVSEIKQAVNLPAEPLEAGERHAESSNRSWDTCIAKNLGNPSKQVEVANRSWETFIQENFGTRAQETPKFASLCDSAQITPVASSDNLVQDELESQERMLLPNDPSDILKDAQRYGDRRLFSPMNPTSPNFSHKPTLMSSHDDPTGFAERIRAGNAASHHIEGEPWPLRDEVEQNLTNGAEIYAPTLHPTEDILSESSDYWSHSDNESGGSDEESGPGQDLGSFRPHPTNEMIDDEYYLPDTASDTHSVGNESYENLSFEEKYGVPRSSTPIRSLARMNGHLDETDSGDDSHSDYGPHDSYPDDLTDQYALRIEPPLEIVPEHEPLTEFNDTYASHRNSGIFANLVDTVRADIPAAQHVQLDNYQPVSQYVLGNATRPRGVSFEEDYPQYATVESSQHESSLNYRPHTADTIPSFEASAQSDSVPTTPSDTSSSPTEDPFDLEPIIKDTSRDRGMTVSSQPAHDLIVHTAKEPASDPNFASAYTSFVASSPGFPPIGQASHDFEDLEERPGSGYSSFGEQTGLKAHRSRVSPIKQDDPASFGGASINAQLQKAIIPGSAQVPEWSTEWDDPVLGSNRTPLSGSPFQPTRTLPRTPTRLSFTTQTSISPMPSSGAPSPSPSPIHRRPPPPIPTSTGSLFVKTRSVFESASPQGSPALAPSPITALSAIRHDSPPPPPPPRRSFGSRPSSLNISEPAKHDSPQEKAVLPEEELDEEAFMPKNLDGNDKPPSPVFAHGRTGSDSSLSKEANDPIVQQRRSSPFLNRPSKIVGGVAGQGQGSQHSVHNDAAREPLLPRVDVDEFLGFQGDLRRG